MPQQKNPCAKCNVILLNVRPFQINWQLFCYKFFSISLSLSFSSVVLLQRMAGWELCAHFLFCAHKCQTDPALWQSESSAINTETQREPNQTILIGMNKTYCVDKYLFSCVRACYGLRLRPHHSLFYFVTVGIIAFKWFYFWWFLKLLLCLRNVNRYL